MALSRDCNLREQGNCGGWGGSWKAVEGVGSKTDTGRIEKLKAPGVGKGDVTGDLREARRSSIHITPPPNSALTSLHSPFHQQVPAACLLGTVK